MKSSAIVCAVQCPPTPLRGSSTIVCALPAPCAALPPLFVQCSGPLLRCAALPPLFVQWLLRYWRCSSAALLRLLCRLNRYIYLRCFSAIVFLCCAASATLLSCDSCPARLRYFAASAALLVALLCCIGCPARLRYVGSGELTFIFVAAKPLGSAASALQPNHSALPRLLCCAVLLLRFA